MTPEQMQRKRIAELEAALLDLRTKYDGHGNDCWCIDPRQALRHGHTGECKQARAALARNAETEVGT